MGGSETMEGVERQTVVGCENTSTTRTKIRTQIQNSLEQATEKAESVISRDEGFRAVTPLRAATRESTPDETEGPQDWYPTGH